MNYTNEQIAKVIELKKKGFSHRLISEEVFKRRTAASSVFYILAEHYYGKKEKAPENAVQALIIDIETAPELAYVWGRWRQNVAPNQVVQRSYMLSWAAKRLGSDEVFADALPFYGDYKAGDVNDYNIVKSLWELLDKADIVIAHNAIKFDLAYANTRFAFHGLGMPSPYKVIDTLQVAKKQFKFAANSLKELIAFFGFEEDKMANQMETWIGCMNGDADAWNYMVEYNKRDITTLENVYLKLRPYDKQHPNVALYADGDDVACPCCGDKRITVLEKNAYTMQSAFESYRCKGCLHVFRSTKRIKGIKIAHAI
ncbi:putative exonuclease [Citrobacter phage CVT22]|uniref:Exonuclease n=1 Tax=Citrobacter phage CVT22 TaxID=1622234 RepID=A0A0R6CA52_9CAUD|nr:DNA polymerase exonuclease subunit [Citrobacter phage CVT22]AJT60732.2 putative exonuclease [Citrobacter phage CVT22]